MVMILAEKLSIAIAKLTKGIVGSVVAPVELLSTEVLRSRL